VKVTVYCLAWIGPKRLVVTRRARSTFPAKKCARDSIRDSQISFTLTVVGMQVKQSLQLYKSEQ
jgi:hypothetical protein